MQKIYDLLIIGGQFAGLTFAKEASKLGLRVLVIEKKDDLTKGFGTTGIVINSWLKHLDIDKKLLYGPVGDVDFYFTKDILLKIDTDIERFYMTKTDELLRQLKAEAIQNGAEIIEGHRFERVIELENLITIEVTYKKKLKKYRGKFIIGADGAHSNVAKQLGLSVNTRFLNGLEYVIPHCNHIKNNKYIVLFDYNIAPGYCAWLILDNQDYILGIAGHLGKFHVHDSLIMAKEFFEKKEGIKMNLKNAKLKVGTIPINGILDKISNKHAMLIGDAGGYCGPLCAGGIFPAILSAKFSVPIVIDYLKNNNINKKAVEKNLDKINIIENKKELFLRHVFDRINDNKELANFGKFSNNKEVTDIITKFIFEKPHDISLNKLLIKIFKKWSLYDDVVRIFIDLLD